MKPQPLLEAYLESEHANHYTTEAQCKTERSQKCLVLMCPENVLRHLTVLL